MYDPMDTRRYLQLSVHSMAGKALTIHTIFTGECSGAQAVHAPTYLDITRSVSSNLRKKRGYYINT
jgi:hypothetical protein